jgi:hypothetical protein
LFYTQDSVVLLEIEKGVKLDADVLGVDGEVLARASVGGIGDTGSVLQHTLLGEYQANVACGLGLRDLGASDVA